MIFWGSEPSEDVFGRKEVVFAIQAKRQEAFLEAQLGEECNFLTVKNVAAAKQLATGKNKIDLLIVLRKSQYGGVDEPIEIVKQIKLYHPNCEVLLIIGAEDEVGVKMLEEGKKIGAITLSSSDKPISAEQICDVLAEVKKSWNRKPMKVYSIFSAKGGSGATTLALGLAAAQNEKMLMVDSKGGIGAFFDKDIEFSNLEEGIVSVGENWDYLKVKELTASIVENICSKYETVIVDEVDIQEGIEYQSILVVDPSAEAIKNARKIMTDKSLVVLNSDMPTIIPKEVTEHELGKSLFHVINHDRELFLRASATMQPVPLGDLWKKLSC